MISLTTFGEFYTSLSPNIRSSILITVILVVFILVVNRKLKNHDATKTPTGIVLIAELLVDMINNFTKDIMGKSWKKYAAYILTLAMFLFFANISGLLGLYPPTANVAITVSLGLVTFAMIQYSGFKNNGFKNYLKSLADPSPLMLPLNIIGEIVVPFSLGFRLFGNILSGSILLALIYGMFEAMNIGLVAPFVTPIFHAVFDIFFGLIQTAVFIILTMVFISSKMPEEEINN
ncbi:MAG TPA: F0F1 ATP synthase subunit A [Bacilli bacterium]|nr:F0F1 ATP synthase subunit A [Bacilli bacterium]